MSQPCRWILIALASLLAAQAPAFGQTADYPNRTLTIVAPSAPGGLYSLFARLIGNKLEQQLGKAAVIENRPGASSVVGALSVARSPADGYTLMVATSSTMAVNVTLYKNLPYDPTTDLEPIALIARVPEVLVVNAALPIHSIADLAKFAKATPGGLNYGSAGRGTSQHLNGELLKGALGIELTHVPYRGMSPAVNDVAGGHIPMMFTPVSFAMPLAQGGKVRMIGVTTAQRVETIPDVPPLRDIGVRDFNEASWFMLVAPGKTPKEIIARLHAELRNFGNDPIIRAELKRQGMIPVDSPPPDELKRFVQSEIVRLSRIVREAGIAGTE